MRRITRMLFRPFMLGRTEGNLVKAADALQIVVRSPQKTESSYTFQIEVTYPTGERQTIAVGITDANFPIRHAAIWDTYFPLMFITRNGGPLYAKEHSRAVIRFEYAASRPIVEFFYERARQFALDIEVTSRLAEIGLEEKTHGDLLLFGGGKDSRLLLGTLREMGKDPVIVCAKGAKYSSDIGGALIFDTLNFSMPNRIVPALMMLPKTVFHGSALGEVHLTRPWHQYTDISTPLALGQTSKLFRSIGLDISFQVPLVTLPYNIVQNILARRYPDLYRNQFSVDKNSRSNKTLHVSLAKRYHGLQYSDVCDEDVFLFIADRFIKQMHDEPATIWGYRHNYEIIAREMRSILSRMSTSGQIQIDVPEEWDEDWIDHIHLYANPDIDPRFLDIFKEHADVLDPRRSHLPKQLRELL